MKIAGVKIRLWPKSLLGRAIMLLVAPTLLLQLIAASFFYQRHWDQVSRRLAGGIAGEIAAVLELAQQAPTPSDRQAMFDMAYRQFQMVVELRAGCEARPRRTAHPLPPSPTGRSGA